jgi:hypothetical protein
MRGTYLFVHDTTALFGAALLVGVGERAYWTTVFTLIGETLSTPLRRRGVPAPLRKNVARAAAGTAGRAGRRTG